MSDKLAALNEAAAIIMQQFSAEAGLAHTDSPTPVELGGLAWLTEFDAEDWGEALIEIRNAMVLTLASEDPAPLREALHAWFTTAAVMRDPLRRAVHMGAQDESDYVEVDASQKGHGGGYTEAADAEDAGSHR